MLQTGSPLLCRGYSIDFDALAKGVQVPMDFGDKVWERIDANGI